MPLLKLVRLARGNDLGLQQRTLDILGLRTMHSSKIYGIICYLFLARALPVIIPATCLLILGFRECIALDPIPCSIWSLPQPLEFVSRVVALGLLVYVVV